MQKLFESLIERGQDQGRGCTRPFRWRSLRDPMRDTVWSQPERPLAPFLRMDCRFLILWDHHGSGGERVQPSDVEERVSEQLERAGVPRERVLAVALNPELEGLFRSVWPRVKELIGAERSLESPDDAKILREAQKIHPRLGLPDDLETALARNPKELFEGLVRLVNLRRAATLYAKIGSQISLRALKREPAALRIASAISGWLPPEPREVS
jgi:hypothetical protein